MKNDRMILAAVNAAVNAIAKEAWKKKRKKEKKKFSTSTGFEPVTKRYPCDALTNEATELIYSIYICHKLEED